MGTYLRIEDGVAVEKFEFDGDISQAFHASLVFVSIDGLDPAPDVGWSYDGTTFTAPVEAAPTVDDLKSYAAARRFVVETGGITVSGASIDTSRESQSLITGAYAYSQAHPDEAITFKAKSGWVTLSAAQVAAIATAVAAHVQAAFAAEQAVDAAIDAGTITTLADIDAADWPA